MVKPQINPFNQFQKESKSHIKKVGLCYSKLVTLQKLWKSANNLQKDKIQEIEKKGGKSVNRILKKSVNRIFPKVPSEANKRAGCLISASYGEKSTKKGDSTHKN